MLVIFLVLFGAVFSAPLNEKAGQRTPTLLVSLDGFRADKLNEYVASNPNCNFAKIINNGAKADYMTPSFPSLTFPNHFTLVTGLYMESHGIVGNSLYDSELNESIRFLQDNPKDTLNPKWWNKGLSINVLYKYRVQCSMAVHIAQTNLFYLLLFLGQF